MGKYENLVLRSEIEISETNKLPSVYDGYYTDNEIFIKSGLSTVKKYETLAEELAHHKLTYGNILDQSQFNNRKFEGYSRKYAMEQLITLDGIIDSFKHGCHNLYTMANFFEVSEGFVQDCIAHYKCKYGLSTLCGDYLIQFEPLRVFEYRKIN
ncbi:ImmA/IrrE family metallo-endopeptidase [Staphylococcus kloosii]|uniref:ImmA/IrrE family metallo-endopeptidase n=1 Tax=Staphylococcus kloosii TaxID=29384 RepID=UPI000D1F8808|nr:ImmA/IrrE family metallo-endopeptidase [Staphylococcus kloosii]PTJ79285.1 toxin [Staphylococcus kloosii]